MKKMFTLLAVGFFITASSFAQWGNGHQHDNGNNGNYGYGNNNYGNGGYNNNDQYRVFNFRTEDDLLRDMNLNRQQERRISRINQQFQQSISRIQFDRFTSAQQKRFQIERLEQERRRDIQNVLISFQRDRYNAWCLRNNYNASSTYGNNGHYGQGNGRW
jgi:hypothetical protein